MEFSTLPNDSTKMECMEHLHVTLTYYNLTNIPMSVKQIQKGVAAHALNISAAFFITSSYHI